MVLQHSWVVTNSIELDVKHSKEEDSSCSPELNAFLMGLPHTNNCLLTWPALSTLNAVASCSLVSKDGELINQ